MAKKPVHHQHASLVDLRCGTCSAIVGTVTDWAAPDGTVSIVGYERTVTSSEGRRATTGPVAFVADDALDDLEALAGVGLRCRDCGPQRAPKLAGAVAKARQKGHVQHMRCQR